MSMRMECPLLELHHVCDRLKRRFPKLDTDVIWDAAVDGYLDIHLAARVSAEDASLALLYVAAVRNVLNALQSDTRRRRRQSMAASWTDVSVPASQELTAILCEGRSLLRTELTASLDPEDTALLEKYLCGELESPGRRVSAPQMEPDTETSEAIRRAKDRIRKAGSRVVSRMRRLTTIDPGTSSFRRARSVRTSTYERPQRQVD